jgi:hypothetical protein
VKAGFLFALIKAQFHLRNYCRFTMILEYKGSKMVIQIMAWLIRAGELLIAVNLLMLLLAAFVKRFRGAAGGLLFASSIAWALILTVWSAVTVFYGWGGFLMAVGLLLGIVGIIPMAFFYLLSHAHWFDLMELLFQVALVLGGWMLAPRLIAKD